MTPVFTITVPDLPESCPHCGHQADEYPLSVFGWRVVVSCPACHVSIGPVMATR